MRKYFFSPENKFYKANMHSHSTDSDGRFTPQQLKEKYIAQGYQIIAYSDHRTMIPHTELDDENFLALTASEFNCGNPAYSWPSNPTYHLNFIAKDKNATEFVPFVRDYSVEGINKVIADAKAAGFLCQYNHPRWSMQTPEDFLGLEGLVAFEIYNNGSELEYLNGEAEYEYELFCRAGKKCAVTAGDDNHLPQDMFGGFTMVSAPALEYDAVISALEKGDCYASRGPIINELYIEDNVLHIECSPVAAISVFSDSRSHKTVRSDEGLTSADLPLDFERKYLRVVIEDVHGRRAWTRAYFDI